MKQIVILIIATASITDIHMEINEIIKDIESLETNLINPRESVSSVDKIKC